MALDKASAEYSDTRSFICKTAEEAAKVTVHQIVRSQRKKLFGRHRSPDGKAHIEWLQVRRRLKNIQSEAAAATESRVLLKCGIQEPPLPSSKKEDQLQSISPQERRPLQQRCTISQQKQPRKSRQIQPLNHIRVCTSTHYGYFKYGYFKSPRDRPLLNKNKYIM